MMIIWLGWMLYEMTAILGFSSSIAIGFMCGATAGVLIGGFIGLRINRKMVRQAEEILDQIDELQKEED